LVSAVARWARRPAAAANGDPDESGDQAGSPGHIAFLIGAPLAVGGGIFLVSRGFRDPEL
jgi:hypothetical protein